MTAHELRLANHKANKEVILWGLTGAAVLGILYILQRFILGGQFIGNMIVETPKLYCLCIWIAFILLSSIFEAFYFTHEVRSGFADNFNEHPLFVCIRACVLIPLWILTSWKIMLCYAFMFSFFHDGQYYRWRDRIVYGTYKKRWWDQSTTSTAMSTKFMTPAVRTILAVISLTVLFLIKN